MTHSLPNRAHAAIRGMFRAQARAPARSPGGRTALTACVMLVLGCGVFGQLVPLDIPPLPQPHTGSQPRSAPPPPRPPPPSQPQNEAVAPQGAVGDPVMTEPALSHNRPLAMVNGVPITLAEVNSHARMLRGAMPDATAEQRSSRSRRILAEEIVMAAEAERLGVFLDDQAMETYLTNTHGAVPDFDALSAELGTSPAHLEQLALRSAMADLYLLHKVGYRHEMSNLVPVDPVMARALNITPRQLRHVYQRDKQIMARPESVRFAAWLGADRAHAQRIADALRAGRAPPEGGEYALHQVPVVSLDETLPPAISRWVSTAVPGAVSPIEPLAGGDHGPCMLVHIMDRLPSHEPTFAEVQTELRRRIQMDFLERAQRQLVAQLVGDAVYWPRDLFDAPL